MPDIRILERQVEVLLAAVQSLSVAVDRIEAELKELREKQNGQRRTHPRD